MIDLRLGNVLDVLAQMPSESVHCIVTSPPYWGLRAYGTEPQVWRNGSEPCSDGHEWGEAHTVHTGRNDADTLAIYDIKTNHAVGAVKERTERRQAGVGMRGVETNTCTRCGAWRGELGLEPTPELFVEHIVAVMREVRRVLRADGTLWLNIGDSFAHNGACGGGSPDGARKPRAQDAAAQDKMKYRVPPGLKPKDLVGIPWRVAFALQADGWYLRSDIIWHKPNPMPESVRDRPTKAHEYIFLLAKQPRYYYDADAVRENGTGRETFYRNDARLKQQRQDYGKHNETPANGRNRRSVWTVTTHPYSGAHFATFPPKLIEPCILAATSERGCCPSCGAPWVRETERRYEPERKTGLGVISNGAKQDGRENNPANGSPGFRVKLNRVDTTLGWRPSCACGAGEPVPATVLDPFNGAGTTGLVALQHGRNYIGIDLKQEYLDMTRERLDKAQIAMVTT